MNKNLVNRIGTSVLPYTNSRVVCPPGLPAHNGHINVLVATPRRSGTHVLIDLILNNVSAFRTRPLYIDLDQCYKQTRPGRNLVRDVAVDAGQVLKTHLPVGLDASVMTSPEVLAVIDAAVVVTVARDRETVMKSLTQMGRSAEKMDTYEQEFHEFWRFWRPRQAIALDFDDLFDVSKVGAALQRIADLTGTSLRSQPIMPPSPQQQRLIFINKALTRILGSGAPRIDTTIHTLQG